MGQERKTTISLTASFTAEPVGSALSFWLTAAGPAAALRFAPYHQVLQQLLDHGSTLHHADNQAAIVLARLSDFLRLSDGKPDAAPAEAVAGEVAAACAAAARLLACPLLVFSCPEPPENARFSALLESALSGAGLAHVFPASGLLAHVPAGLPVHDPESERVGHIPFSAGFFALLGTRIAREVHRLLTPPVKAIAVDCDGTLWNGVCGEDGPEAVSIDPAKEKLHCKLAALARGGVLLCLCSKNSADDVSRAFQSHPGWPLQFDDFLASRINWQPKPANILSIAAEIGISPASFLFIDDNPVECASVQAELPETAVFRLPADPAEMEKLLDHVWPLDPRKTTAEDAHRNAFYRDEAKRRSLFENASSYARFLAELELNVRIEPVDETGIPRASQLTLRTNQFNFTTIRRTPEEIAILARSPDADVLGIHVSDRFGDYGFAGLLIAGADGDALDVDTFLLSCRVVGRGVEHRMLEELVALARRSGLSRIRLRAQPTDRNQPVFDFLAAQKLAPDNSGAVFLDPAFEVVPLGRQIPKEPGPDPDSRPVSIRVAGGATSRLPALEMGSQEPAPPVSGFGQRRGPGFEADAPRSLSSAADTIPSPPDWGQLAALSASPANLLDRLTRKAARPRPELATPFIAPGTPIERQIFSAWQAVLQIERIGVNDNFFELGGTSIQLVEIHRRLTGILPPDTPLVSLFQHPSIADLAARLDRPAVDENPIVRRARERATRQRAALATF